MFCHNIFIDEVFYHDKEFLQLLLFLYRCNASIKKKNDKGMTAYDLALKSGNEQISSLFASKLGQGLLDKLTKPKNISLDVFWSEIYNDKSLSLDPFLNHGHII